jgi:type IV pilus assembly protein PilW
MQKTNNTLPNVAKQTGFTLIELMIGLVIGLIATLVIVQVFSSFEGKKRVTTGAADAQTNGSIGLYNIQRDVQSAGYGIPILDGDPFTAGGVNNSALLCTGIAGAGLQVPSETGGLVEIFPIKIDNGTGSNGSDAITVRRGSTEFGGLATSLTNVAGTSINVTSNLGCVNNSILLYIDGPTSCVATRVTALVGTDTIKLNSVVGMASTPTSKVACIGENYEEIKFSVNNNQLVRTAGKPPVASPIISDIVNIQAQYGLSNVSTSNKVTSWVNSVTNANRNQVRAVRVAIVARSGKLENAAVTNTCSSLIAARPTGLCAWEGSATSPAPAINLTANANWNKYRYRVYEAIIPMRNFTYAGRVL